MFLHGFSHGSKGVLGGKKLIVSFTTGAPAAAYQKDGVMRHEIADYLPQFETTAALCNLDLCDVVCTNGVSYSARATQEAQAAQLDAAHNHAERLIAAIKAA